MLRYSVPEHSLCNGRYLPGLARVPEENLMTTRTHGPPSATKSELEMITVDSGLGVNAIGQHNFVVKNGAGACTTSVVGRGLPVTTRT